MEIKQETANKLAALRDEIEKSKSDTKYVKFADQDKKIFNFDPDKIETLYKHWNGSTYEESKEFKDGFTKNYRFIVQDPNMNNLERIWDITNGKLAQTILEHLLQNHFTLKIKRIGSDKNTIYDVEEI